MLRQDSSPRHNFDPNESSQINTIVSPRSVDFNIQRELDQLEEIVLDSPRIPLTRQTLIDEEKLLNQLDLVRMNLPEAFEHALAVIEKKQELLADAEAYAQKIVQSAQQKAAQILDETGIIQQAQREANQIRQQVQQECETLQRQTFSEIEQMRRSVHQELQQLHQQTLAECQDIEAGADRYADRVLNNLEQQLSDMLSVVRNGRQQLYGNSAADAPKASPKKLPPSSGDRAKNNSRAKDR